MADIWVTDSNGNVFKNNVYVPASNYKYVPASVLQEAAKAKQNTPASHPTQSIAQPSPTKGQAAAATSPAAPAASDRTRREAERAAFTGWDNDPQVRSLQERWWAIYVDTGRKDTAEQKDLNDQAQKVRAYNNPMYDPSKSPAGPKDWMDAGMITPADTTPNADKAESGLDAIMNVDNFGSYLKVGMLGVGAMFILSMFRR